eukprot:839054-Pleurochrysis_carterae.AAC.3
MHTDVAVGRDFCVAWHATWRGSSQVCDDCEVLEHPSPAADQAWSVEASEHARSTSEAWSLAWLYVQASTALRDGAAAQRPQMFDARPYLCGYEYPTTYPHSLWTLVRIQVPGTQADNAL